MYFQAFAAQLTLQLGQVSAQVQQLSTQVAQIGPLRAEVQQLSTQVAQIGPLRAEVANMRVEFSSAIRNSNAMSFNRGVVLPGHALQPLVTRAGEVPADFPATRADLRNLQGQVCSHLLIAYEQPVPDAVWARKEALSNFIGTPPA